jgi:hypothetical protein
MENTARYTDVVMDERVGGVWPTRRAASFFRSRRRCIQCTPKSFLYYNLHPHVTTITIIHYAVSHLHSLQSYTFVTTSTYYTLTRLHWLTSQLANTFSNHHRHYIFTFRNSRRELTPRIHFLRLLLNNWLLNSHSGNWTKPANSFAYIAKLC